MIQALTIFVFSLLISINSSYAESYGNVNLDIYNIDMPTIDTFKTIERGTTLNLILNNDISTKKDKENSLVNFETQDNEDLKASGVIIKISGGGRFSSPSTLKFSTSKLFLDNGQEVFVSANSPLLVGAHPPHANTNSLGLAKTITALSIGFSSVTFGASLGISFLVSGILSAYQNGITDFLWGGLNGSGLSLVENILRKQPEIFLSNGTVIPFTLSEDLKISKGIQKEKIEPLILSNEEALNKINNLLKRGDLAGAIELSAKTGQEEIYNKLITIFF